MQVSNTNHKNKSGKGVFKAIFLLVAWLVIFSLAKDVLHIQNGFDRVTEAKTRLEQEEIKNVELKKRYEEVRTEEHRERLIRDQLNMQKEGEVIVVLPKSMDLEVEPKDELVEDIPNWKKWVDLLM